MKIFAISLNLHEFRIENLGDYNAVSEMVGDIIIGEHKQTTAMRFKFIEQFESYVFNNVMDYIAGDTILTSYVNNLDTPDFNMNFTTNYGKGKDCKQDLFEDIGDNCYNPTSGHCFIECIKIFEGKDSQLIFLDFIRDEKGRTYVMNKAGIQPLCIANTITNG